MKKLFLLIAALGTIAATVIRVVGVRAQSPAPINITIQNPSFETPIALPGIDTSHNPSCGTSADSIPGWVMQPLAQGGGGGVSKWTCDPPPPDGSMVAYAGYGMRLVQDLHVPAQAGVYTFTVYVANWFEHYTGPYALTVWVGGRDIPVQGTRYSHQICTTSGYALYDFTPIPLVCPMPDYIAPNNGFNWTDFNGGDLLISIDGTGWTVMPDKVSLIFVPET